MSQNGESCEAEFLISNRDGRSQGGLTGGGVGAKAHSPLPFLKNKVLLGGKSIQFPYFKPLEISLPPPSPQEKVFRHPYTILGQGFR